MLLHRLKQKVKVPFLELAYYVANSDNDFSSKEEDVINSYCVEMQIDNIDFDKSNIDLDLTLSNIESSQSQKIVLLEIMALVYSDNILHQAEAKVLQSMADKFQLNPKLVSVYAEWSKAMFALTIQGISLIEL